MSEIGNLLVKVDADTTGLQEGAKRGQDSLQRFSGGMERTTEIARRLTGVLATVGVGIGFAQGVREVANFQRAINGLAAASNATADQMESLEKQSRALGSTSQFSAQQAAEAQRFLAQAGFEVNEVLGATPGILALATAGQMELGQAADIASNVLGGMRMEVEEINRVNDVLAATASRSNTTIQQLGQALSFAAPFASGAGISIEEAAAAIGTMSDAGIQASRAGTGLTGVIRQLSNVTSGGEKVLEKYGLSMEQVNIEARGLGPVLETLRAANINTADALELFGSEAGAAAQVLVNDYSGAIQDATGESERMAAQLEQGLGPAFKSLQSAVSESVLQMGDSGLAGALENLVRTTTGVISVWNGMGNEWAEANGEGQEVLATVNLIADSTKGLTAAIAGGGGAVAAMSLFTGGAKAATGAMVALNAAIRANPVFAFISVVGAATGVVYAFRDELGLTGTTAEDTADALDKATKAAGQYTKAIKDMTLEDVNNAVERTKTKLAEVEAMNNVNKLIEDRIRLFELERQMQESGGDVEGIRHNIKLLDEEIARTAQHTEKANELRETLAKLEAQRDRLNTDAPDAPDSPDSPSGTGGSGGDDNANERLKEQMAERLEIIRRSVMSEKELETAAYLDKAEELNELRESGAVTEEEHRQLLRDLAMQHEKRLTEIDARGRETRTEADVEAHEMTLERLREQYENEEILKQEFYDRALELEQNQWAKIQATRSQALRSLAQMVGDSYGEQAGMAAEALAQIVSVTATQSKKAFKIQKAAAIASAIVNTYQGVSKSLSAYPMPLAGVMAAAHLATGMAQVQKIRSQSFSGGGGGGSVSSGAGAGSAAGAGGAANGAGGQQPQQPAGGTLTVQGISAGSLFSGEAMKELAEEMLEYQRRGGSVVIQ